MGTSKVWLIAGVSHGLGLIAVRYLLSREQTIIATTGDERTFDAALRLHPRLKVIVLDLLNDAGVKAAVDHIARDYGRIDMLINIAGNCPPRDLADQPPEADNFCRNFESTIRMVRHVLPVMRRAGSGHIINLFPACGQFDASAPGTFDLSRYIVEKFTDGLKNEGKGLAIKITLIGAGTFQTSFSQPAGHSAGPGFRGAAGAGKLNSGLRAFTAFFSRIYTNAGKLRNKITNTPAIKRQDQFLKFKTKDHEKK